MEAGPGLPTFAIGAAASVSAMVILILARLSRASEAALLGLGLFATSSGVAAALHLNTRCRFEGCEFVLDPPGLVLGLTLTIGGILSLIALRRRLDSVSTRRTKPIPSPLPLQIVIVALSGLLLLSWGGQIIASPVTVPALLWTIRDSRGVLRGFAMAVLALTMPFVVGGSVFLAFGDTGSGLVGYAGKTLGWALLAAEVAGVAWLVRAASSSRRRTPESPA